MAIYFDNNDPAVVEFLTHLGFDQEEISEKAEIGEDDLEVMGINPKAIQLLDPNAVETPHGCISLQTDYFLSHEGAEKGLELLTHLGGLASFKTLTSKTSCWTNHLKYFYEYQAMNQLVFLPFQQEAITPLCPFDAGMLSLMQATVYPVTELPETIRAKALPALTFLYRQKEGQEQRGCVAVVIASDQQAAYLLTNRHCFNEDYNKNIALERRRQIPEALSEPMEGENFALRTIKTPLGDVLLKVPLSKANVIRRYAGLDLVLIQIPELAGHPSARLSDRLMRDDEIVYLLGGPTVMPVSYRTISAYDYAKLERRLSSTLGQLGMVEGLDDTSREWPIPSLLNDPWEIPGKIYGSVGKILRSPGQSTSTKTVYELHSTAMIRPGMSGGGFFSSDGLLVGLGARVSNTTNDNAPRGGLVNGSAGPLLYFSLDKIRADIQKMQQQTD